MDKTRTVCFSGYRLEKMTQHGDKDAPEIRKIKGKLQQAILDAIAEGYIHFICGMANGWDEWAYNTYGLLGDLEGIRLRLKLQYLIGRR